MLFPQNALNEKSNYSKRKEFEIFQFFKLYNDQMVSNFQIQKSFIEYYGDPKSIIKHTNNRYLLISLRIKYFVQQCF